jgi:hypothetical protein
MKASRTFNKQVCTPQSNSIHSAVPRDAKQQYSIRRYTASSRDPQQLRGHILTPVEYTDISLISCCILHWLCFWSAVYRKWLCKLLSSGFFTPYSIICTSMFRLFGKSSTSSSRWICYRWMRASTKFSRTEDEDSTWNTLHYTVHITRRPTITSACMSLAMQFTDFVEMLIFSFLHN